MGLKENIADYRKKMGLTQEQLAEKCNVSRQAVTKWKSGESEPSIAKVRILSTVFNISIDELIAGTKNNVSHNNSEKLQIDYSMLSAIANDLTKEYINIDNEFWKLVLLENIYKVLKTKYIDSNEKVRDEYLLDNTKLEDRIKSTKLFIGNSCFTKELFQEYVDGKCEIDIVFEKLFKVISEKSSKVIEQDDEKGKSKLARAYCKIQNILVKMKKYEQYSDTKIKELDTEYRSLVIELKDDNQMSNIVLFYLQEIQEAWDNKNISLLNELSEDWWKLKSFIWGKITL
ncbi:XRE family transcriptional regulator [Eubacterium ventriosum]|uniref:XRE family transcriptional regulator n=1 Tax=Eubacterium ventriosum TaxID=39496 RepID=A0A413R8W2_9FIRM|nr:helix-turn-helix transcriptional regulator [Eubacterium ventriosum]RHA18716.1 XRE family transcriptional regulator [Eubacterium ventriosum]RHB17373.1 XRE family transcriptional regulator [Eubacterium ventriosum]